MMALGMTTRRAAAFGRALSTATAEIHVPEHLKRFTAVTLPMSTGRCMLIGKPLFKYPIAVVPPPAEVVPLLSAIRDCESRPFRIISYESEAGKVFNCSFFNDENHMRSWISWLSENALTPGSQYHDCMARAAADGESLPDRESLLFGRGTTVLTDTRFGEYQVGMSINFSRQVPLSHELHVEMCEIAASSEFEERIARCMQENEVAYFGRLAMLEDSPTSATSPPALVTALRYGTMEDAQRGTAVVRELMSPELTRWFGNQYSSLLGTTTKVLEL